MITLTTTSMQPAVVFGQASAEANAAAAFVAGVRTRLTNILATTPVQLIDTGGGTFAATIGSVQFSADQVAEFRQAVDTLRAALGQHGVTRARLDELNAFPDLELSDTSGQLRTQVDNLLQIFNTVVKGARRAGRPGALPIAGSIFLGLLAIGVGVYLWTTRR
jgi:hypothetical protein